MSRWDQQRAQELAAASALGAASSEEQREIAAMRDDPEFCELCEQFELSAAALDVGLWKSDTTMPAHLHSKVAASASSWMGESGRPVARNGHVHASSPRAGVDRRSGARRSWGGWVVAAAAVAIAAAGWWPRLTGPTSTGSPVAPTTLASALASMQSQTADVQRISWTRGGDASATESDGEVLWSASLQRGYMVFRGLRANDPQKEQYQLWIFDPARDERYPVDGGLFDVAAGCTEVVVPIQPKLSVPNASLFVVTVEKPGGVWVSDRSRIATVAKRSS